MSLEIKDWVDFCKGVKDFEKSHFYTLFMDNGNGKEISASELETVFSYFPNTDNLIKKLQNYYSPPTEAKNVNMSSDYYLGELHSYLSEVSDLFIGDELEPYFSNDMVYVDSFETILSAKQNHWQNEQFVDVIDDYFFDNRIVSSKQVTALFEAYYGFVHNFQLVWYLGSPLIGTDLKFDNYYNLWRVGGDFAFTEDQIVISKIA